MRWIACAVSAALLVGSASLAAQAPGRSDAEGIADAQMGDAPMGDAPMMRHMELTALRPGTAADTARAVALVRVLRQAIAPYASVDSAEAAGYRFPPDLDLLPRKALVHMGNPRLRPDGATGFEPSRPQALLYRRRPDGGLVLAGAMYTAPEGATLDQLDARVPLSVARWHRHVDVCRPRAGAPRGRALRRITTPEACARAGGRFRAESPRYMVHVMTDTGDDLAAAFPQGGAHDRMQMSAP